MFCEKCGNQIPDDALFCPKCGFKQEQTGANREQKATQSGGASEEHVVAGPSVQELKCPGCGAPIKPQFGEMVITCEYCGASITLENSGWKNIKKHTMLPISLATKDQAIADLKDKMDKGLLKRHLEEQSQLEELNLTYVPYWIVPVSARTNYTAVNVAAEVGTIAATAAIIGLASEGMGGRGGGGRMIGGGFGMGMVEGTMVGGMMGGGFGGGNQNLRAYTLDNNYNYPVVAVKALSQYQPRDYAFDLSKRVDFDTSRISKGIRTLNGDIGEDSAKYEAKTNVDQLQSAKAHQQHHMIRSIKSESDTGEAELLHAPVWFAKFTHKNKTIIMVIDASSGGVINSVGVD